ncbi:MAG: triose-phosphate isomerase family protein [Pseudomonadota bacterium]
MCLQLLASLPTSADPTLLAIAYEPVWAIGSGRTPEPADVATVVAALREALCGRFGDGGSIPVLYGGSVGGSNAADLLASGQADGLLVGGASLDAARFLPIAAAFFADRQADAA